MKTPANILEVAGLQPDYMGFIFYKGSKRYVADLSADLIFALPDTTKKTGVFVDEDIAELSRLAEAYGLAAVQLHGAESADYCVALKAALPPGVELIKAFGLSGDFDFGQLENYVGLVDFFLFDTQTPDHGGSGKTFDWTLLREYTLDVPYFLSGGIGLESLGELSQITDERLYAVDVNSRFELSPGLKDIDKLKDFKSKLPL